MHRKIVWGVIFLLFLLEGSLLPWMIPSAWRGNVSVTPHLVLVAIIYVSIYLNRYSALIFGLFFGFLQDFVYYGHMIGVYAFSLGLTGYLCGLFFGRSHIHILPSMLLMAFGNLLYEAAVYGCYRLFNVINSPFEWAFTHQMLPSILFNLLLALLIYVPVRKLFEKIGNL